MGQARREVPVVPARQKRRLYRAILGATVALLSLQFAGMQAANATGLTCGFGKQFSTIPNVSLSDAVCGAGNGSITWTWTPGTLPAYTNGAADGFAIWYQYDNSGTWLASAMYGYQSGFGISSFTINVPSGHQLTDAVMVGECYTGACPGSPSGSSWQTVSADELKWSWGSSLPSSPACATQLRDLRVSWDETTSTAYARVEYVGTIPDGDHFYLYDNTTHSTIYLELTPSHITEDGAAGWYFWSGQVGGPLASALAVGDDDWFNVGLYGAANTCGEETTVVSGVTGPQPTSEPDTNPGTSSDAGDGTSCGFSLNPVHWVICLFYPPAGMTTQWQTRLDDIKSKPPINIMIGGSAYIQDTYNSAGCAYGDAGAGNCSQISTDFQGPGASGNQNDTTGHLDIIGAAADIVQNNAAGQIVYKFADMALWIGWIWFAWGRISNSFGGKETDT